ncbi:uncharacterized protein LOC130900587 [Diorhabda carinulata]|uniref:uncharacterized protein LOC130900587 n=1 Tax=Diorhabda carinulata TaxID=1163345 RepID=UPI0025A079A3|nr:uncharacterized protein LOC130900587 [Diorhabda carinulata]
MIFFHALIVFSGFTRLLYLKTEAPFDIRLCHPLTYIKIGHLLETGTRPLCFQNKLERFLADGSNIKSESELKLFFQVTCSEPDVKIRCYENIVEESKMCLNKTEKEMLKILENLDDALTSYVCKNEKELTKYFEELNESCFVGLREGIEKCFNLNSTGNTFHNIATFTVSEFEESEKCMNDVIFSQCSENVKNVISSTMKILKKNIYSQKKPKSLHRIVRDLGMSEKMQRIEYHVKNACVKNGELTEKLENTLTKMKICIREKSIFLVPKREYIAHMDNCTKDAIHLFKSCLPEKYKYLPKLIFDIIDSMVSFLYDDFTIISSELTPCLPKLQEEKSNKTYQECVEKIMENTKDELVDSKSEFCERFIPLNQCFITEVHKHCKSSPELTKFENDFMNAVKKPCGVK